MAGFSTPMGEPRLAALKAFPLGYVHKADAGHAASPVDSKMEVMTYPIGGGIEPKMDGAVRDLCHSRKPAKGWNGKRILLKADIVEKLVEKMIWAAAHAASGPIPNRVRGRGAPPDNARIILADGILRACYHTTSDSASIMSGRSRKSRSSGTTRM